MAFSINHVTLLGNVTKDLELKYTPSQTAVVRLSVATNFSRKQQDGTYKDFPTFHNVVVFGKIAEFLSKNVGKGSKIYVDGRIDNRSYQANDGTTKYVSEIIADNVIPMMAPKSAGQTTAAPAPRPTAPVTPPTPQEEAYTAEAVDIFSAGVDEDGVPF
jgi:single-strand DNA-binding protein